MTAPTVGVTVHLGRLPQAIVAERQSRAVVHAAMRAAVAAGLPYLQRELAKATPVGGTGIARASVTSWADMTVTQSAHGAIGYAAPGRHAMFANSGTRPHWPPRAPLELYAARKLGHPLGSPEARRAAYLLQRAISRHGTRPQHFVEKTTSSRRAATQRLMGRAARAVLVAFRS